MNTKIVPKILYNCKNMFFYQLFLCYYHKNLAIIKNIAELLRVIPLQINILNNSLLVYIYSRRLDFLKIEFSVP